MRIILMTLNWYTFLLGNYHAAKLHWGIWQKYSNYTRSKTYNAQFETTKANYTFQVVINCVVCTFKYTSTWNCWKQTFPELFYHVQSVCIFTSENVTTNASIYIFTAWEVLLYLQSRCSFAWIHYSNPVLTSRPFNSRRTIGTTSPITANTWFKTV